MNQGSGGSRQGERRPEKRVSPRVQVPDSKFFWGPSSFLTLGPQMPPNVILTASLSFSLSHRWFLSLASPAMIVMLFNLTPFLFLQGTNGWPGLPRFNPWIGKIPQRRAWQPTPVFLPGESHGQRSLVGYSPQGHTELDTTMWLTLSLSPSLGRAICFVQSTSLNVTFIQNILTRHSQ